MVKDVLVGEWVKFLLKMHYRIWILQLTVMVMRNLILLRAATIQCTFAKILATRALMAFVTMEALGLRRLGKVP